MHWVHPARLSRAPGHLPGSLQLVRSPALEPNRVKSEIVREWSQSSASVSKRGGYCKGWAGGKLAAVLESAALAKYPCTKCPCPPLKSESEWLWPRKVPFRWRGAAEAVQVGRLGSLVGARTAGIWTEHVARTVAPTALWLKEGLCPLCACHRPPAVMPLASQMRGGRQNERNRKLVWGRWEGRWENGLDFVWGFL